ncbi:uncharacterized protein LOC128274549 [Anopheles cruzii]|uniref:uncharacterized protein LOC128274549 n=1 Tax=Anopheles cruzii TaxID=68878 RepID=UPI0022EC1B0A|nr:uncharacterized protein LOC128274549 [Anopheles cruzii]
MASVTRMLPSKIYDIEAHSSKVTCLNLGETGRVLVTGGQDCNIKLWALNSNQCFMTLPGHNSSIECVRFAYSDDFVYSADDTGVIKLWNLNVGEATSLFGHMKSVRTLDVHPLNDNYAVSGSNDTSIRLWDVRQKVCVKRYRGHMSHVNSVKISPDGLWIASAGNEGSVIIWDIRMSKLFMEFTERQTPATYVQYHPSDLLMAAGRQDGTVDLYDLEKRQLLSRSVPPAQAERSAQGLPVRCVLFDESGKCLFVGTAAAITVLGWEPDQEFDRIESYWCTLGDMHLAGSELIFGTFEKGSVTVHAVPFTGLRAFNASSFGQPFNHNETSRKSFNRGSGKLRLSIGDRGVAGGGSSKMSTVAEASVSAASGLDDFSGANGGMSPNLSIEMIDEEDMNALISTNKTSSQSVESAMFVFDTIRDQRVVHSPVPNAQDVPPSSTSTATLLESGLTSSNHSNNGSMSFTSPPLINSHHHVQEEMDRYNLKPSSIVGVDAGYSSDLHYFPLKSSALPEPEEDYPVNNAQPPDYAPKVTGGNAQDGMASSSEAYAIGGGALGSRSGSRQHDSTTGHFAGLRNSATDQRRLAGVQSSHHRSSSNLVHRIATSKSTLELNKLTGDEPVTFRKPISRGSSPIRNNQELPIGSHFSGNPLYQHQQGKLLRSESNAQIGRDRKHCYGGPDRHQRSYGNTGGHNSNIKVEIVTKPVVRSKTSLDMRHHGRSTTSIYGQRQSSLIHSNSSSSMATVAAATADSLIGAYGNINGPLYEYGNESGGRLMVLGYGSTENGTSPDENAIHMMRNEHIAIMQTLCNRTALLGAIRNYTKTGNVTNALKVAVRMDEQQILVDVLGAILEKTTQWSLDMCVLLLPKVYDLLQSEHKFYCTRACDTLRVILSTFLPVIRENTDSWAACTLGVDVSREERQNKCLECKSWLLKIRCLPENAVMGNNLQQLQNMIVDI